MLPGAGIPYALIPVLQGGYEIELDDNLRQISFYSVEDGDTVLVRW